MELTLKQLRDKAIHELAVLDAACKAEDNMQWAAEDPAEFFFSQVREVLNKGKTAVSAPEGVSPYEDSDLKTFIEEKLTQHYPWMTFFIDHNFTYHFKVVSND